MNLYDDIPPIRVQGYASVFRHTYPVDDEGLERIEPGAFDLSDPTIYACFGHERAQRFANVADGTLRVWQDSYGLGFELDVPATWPGISLARGIRAGHFREASIGLQAHRSHRVTENGREVRVVTRASIAEVSIVSIATNPLTSIWLDDEGEDLPAYSAGMRGRWQHGRMKAEMAKRRPKASAAPLIHARAKLREAQVLAKIDRILAQARRDGRDLPRKIF